MIHMKKISLAAIVISLLTVSCTPGHETRQEAEEVTAGNVIVYPAPANEPLNDRYKVTVDGLESPVYDVKVASASAENRRIADQNIALSGNYFEVAGMTYFDLVQGEATVSVTVNDPVTSVSFLPESSRVINIEGNTFSFTVDQPENLTVVVNEDPVRALHIFVNEKETGIPDPKDPDVVYFGPGSYRLPAAELEDGMTVYIAGGSVVRCYVGPHEWYTINPVTQQKNYDKFYMCDLTGKNITVKGRGILCLNDIPTHSRRAIHVKGENISLEGIIIRGASEWAVEICDSKQVNIDRVKIISYRAQTDGINIASSDDIHINNCFIRTFGYPVRTDGSISGITGGSSILLNDGNRPLETALTEKNSVYTVYNP